MSDRVVLNPTSVVLLVETVGHLAVFFKSQFLRCKVAITTLLNYWEGLRHKYMCKALGRLCEQCLSMLDRVLAVHILYVSVVPGVIMMHAFTAIFVSLETRRL